MSWHAIPAAFSPGHLVTADEWNDYIFENVAYLKGQAGNIEIEDDILPYNGNEKIGFSTNPWDEGHFDKLFAGPRCSLHKFIREVVINWEDASDANYQVTQGDSGAGAAFQMGGFGQSILKVDNNQAGAKWIYSQAEQNNAHNTSFNASRSPYYRQEFVVNAALSTSLMFMGLRQTPGGSLPVYTSEHSFGLVWNGTIWIFQSTNAGSVDVSATQTISVNTRHVIELLKVGSNVEVYLDGVLKDTLTVVPTGELEWSVLLKSDGLGGATDSLLTLGKVILQEDLS